jgi:hypothetical protein
MLWRVSLQLHIPYILGLLLFACGALRYGESVAKIRAQLLALLWQCTELIKVASYIRSGVLATFQLACCAWDTKHMAEPEARVQGCAGHARRKNDKEEPRQIAHAATVE